MSATIQTITTPDGPFTILADADQRVLASGWTDSQADIMGRLRRTPRGVMRGETAAAESVRAYYAGDLTAIDAVEVVQSGTDFQTAGWALLRTITPGAPLTYAEFAEALGRPRATRAAAAICARNAPALFVPCHRVRRTDGSAGGFAWGLHIKQSLLAHEGAAG